MLLDKLNLHLSSKSHKIIESEQQNTFQETRSQQNGEITLELVQRMVNWDKSKHVLEDWKWKVMNDVIQGRKPFSDSLKYAFYLNLEILKKHGFE